MGEQGELDPQDQLVQPAVQELLALMEEQEQVDHLVLQVALDKQVPQDSTAGQELLERWVPQDNPDLEEIVERQDGLEVEVLLDLVVTLVLLDFWDQEEILELLEVHFILGLNMQLILMELI